MSSLPEGTRVTPEIHAAAYAPGPVHGSGLPGSCRPLGAGRNGSGAAVRALVRGVGGVGTSVSDDGARPAWYGPSAAVPVPRISRTSCLPPARVTTVSQNSQMLHPGLPGSGLL